MKFRCGVIIAFVGGLFVVSSASATTFSQDATVQFTFNSRLDVRIDDANIEILDLTPGTSSDSNIVGITVGTNNSVGYTIKATVGDATYSTTNMVHGNGTNTFSSLAVDDDLVSISADNTWGYATSNDDGSSWSNFSGLPVYTDTAKQIATTNAPTNDVIKFKINAKASTSQAAGDYRNVINFSVVANVPPRTIEDALEQIYIDPIKDPINDNYVIQSINEDVCDLTEDIGTSAYLSDIRDHKIYRIAKLADGRCWMQDNMALDLTDADVLSNMNESNTNATNTVLGYLKNGGGAATDRFAMNGVVAWGRTSLYADPLVDIMNADKIVTVDGMLHDRLEQEVIDGEWKVGAYYNYCAASAGSYCYGIGDSYREGEDKPDTDIDAEYDICPIGWRLPTITNFSGQYDHVNDSEFGKLYSAYYDSNRNTHYENFRRAFLLPLSGQFWEGTALDQGDYSYLWSSTYSGPASMSYLYANSGNGVARGGYNRIAGYSVRCIGKESPKVTVSFDANGGTGSMTSQEVKVNKKLRLKKNTLTRNGYVFVGWNTNADGTGAGYADMADIKPAANTTLYAQWSENSSHGGSSDYYGRTIAQAYAEAYEANNLSPLETGYLMQNANLLVDGKTICERTTVIGSEMQVADLRDGNVYWIAKLKDGKCWMTQNLDLIINGPLTSERSDINVIGVNGYTTETGYSQNGDVITWTPTKYTILPSQINSNGTATWSNGTEYGYSLDPWNWYMDGTVSSRDHPVDNFLATGGIRGYVRKDTPYDTIGTHGHVGNYYAYATAVATNHVSTYNNEYSYNDPDTYAPQNSICPKGWRLPVESSTTKEYTDLVNAYQGWITFFPERLVSAPLYFLEAGLFTGSQEIVGVYGQYLSNIYYSDGSVGMSYGLEIGFSNNVIRTELHNYTGYRFGPGKSVRCLMR